MNYQIIAPIIKSSFLGGRKKTAGQTSFWRGKKQMFCLMTGNSGELRLLLINISEPWVLVRKLRASLLSQRLHLIHISSNMLLYYKYLLLAPVTIKKKKFKILCHNFMLLSFLLVKICRSEISRSSFHRLKDWRDFWGVFFFFLQRSLLASAFWCNQKNQTNLQNPGEICWFSTSRPRQLLGVLILGAAFVIQQLPWQKDVTTLNIFNI